MGGGASFDLSGRDWFAYLRPYGPEAAAFDGTWRPHAGQPFLCGVDAHDVTGGPSARWELADVFVESALRPVAMH